MKILLLKFRHIGDVLLSSALIRRVSQIYPQARIDVALNRDCLPMLEGNPHISRLFPYDRERIKGLSPLRRIHAEYAYVRSILQTRYDLVINLTEGDRGAIIARLSRAPRRLGIRSKNRWVNRLLRPYTLELEERHDLHTVQKDCQFIRLLGADDEQPKSVELFYDTAQREKIQRWLSKHDLERFVVVHPVSRWLFKCWDEQKFARVIDEIQRRMDRPVVITASPAPKEMERIRELLSFCETEPLSLAGELSLGELAALIDRAELFLGVDTAPMHMAAALGTPVLALFGPSNPVAWGPWANGSVQSSYRDIRVTQHNGPHTVIQHGGDKIYFHDGRKFSRAMMSITVPEVLAELERYLEGGKRP